MSRDYGEYITGPPPRRRAPWIFAGVLVVAVVAAVVDSDGDSPLAGPLAVLVGVTMLVQVVNAIRTGTLFGIFPGTWPPHVTRRSYSVGFWLLTVFYAAVAFVFLGLGV